MREYYYNEETEQLEEYDPHTGESYPADPEVAAEWEALRGANPYTGDHDDPFDEFRGDVAMELRERGYVELADYYGSVPNEVAEEDYHDVEGRVAQFADEFIEFMEESC